VADAQLGDGFFQFWFRLGNDPPRCERSPSARGKTSTLTLGSAAIG
jgi:hypothetical protein